MTKSPRMCPGMIVFAFHKAKALITEFTWIVAQKQLSCAECSTGNSLVIATCGFFSWLFMRFEVFASKNQE